MNAETFPLARISERLGQLVQVVSTIERTPVLTDDELERLVELGLKGKR